MSYQIGKCLNVRGRGGNVGDDIDGDDNVGDIGDNGIAIQ